MAIPLPLRPQPEIEWHLLHLLNARGRVETQAAYRALARRLRLTPKELDVTVYREKEPERAWHYECRQAIRRLRDQGYALPPPPKGVWIITPEGREAARHRTLEYDRMATTISVEEVGL